MVRPRKDGRDGLPDNLYVLLRGGREYYSYRSPITKRSLSIGYDREKAITYANEANAALGVREGARQNSRLSVKHGHVDERGLLDANTIARKAMLYDHVCGIYFLLEGEKIVYVGQSTSALSRVAKGSGLRSMGWHPLRRFRGGCVQQELTPN